MSTAKPNQKYLVKFWPDEGLSDADLRQGLREAARQLHAIGEYPWKGLPSDVTVDADYVNAWKVSDDGRAERICDSHAHAVQVHTFLDIVENFNCDMEPIAG